MISVPGDVASATAPEGRHRVALPATTIGPASPADVAAMAALINAAETVAIFGGDGCQDAQSETRHWHANSTHPSGSRSKANSGSNTTTPTPSA